ncbi:MAG: hypothetical protein H6797_03510 [Candidatus Nomurabacteria bacterium]|nr:MAG: hypothetical protein H6797_03510 [Candidatus Nomurabacteria bacterium]
MSITLVLFCVSTKTPSFFVPAKNEAKNLVTASPRGKAMRRQAIRTCETHADRRYCRVQTVLGS